MTIPSLRVEQHAQILGFSIIGYGLGKVLELIVPLFFATKLSASMGDRVTRSMDLESYLWPQILFGVGLFVLCIFASIAIRNREISPRALGLPLAVIVFGFFPLGTLLSVYILIYLFVIDDGHYGTEPTLNTVHLNE